MKMKKKKTYIGPNDASGVVWASFRRLHWHQPLYVMKHWLVIIEHKRKEKTYKWPKRRLMRRFSLFSSSPPFMSSITTHIYWSKTLVYIEELESDEKNSPTIKRIVWAISLPQRRRHLQSISLSHVSCITTYKGRIRKSFVDKKWM